MLQDSTWRGALNAMPFYAKLKGETGETRKRTTDGLLDLRRQLADQVPARTTSETLLLATWNIREFDSPKYGDRSTESLYFIAEVLDHFDLIAVQEVRSNLAALQKVLGILGKWWDKIYTDVTYGRAGNDERLAILYDKRKVNFIGLAGEIVLPEVKGEPVRQLARSPFICGFQCGWIKFNLCTVHTYYGSANPNEPRRIKEIDDLAGMLEKGSAGDAGNTILLGDFNIFKRTDKTFEALARHGFKVPAALTKLPTGSNIKQDKEYDQIAFLERKQRFTVSNAGIFNFYKSVFKDDEEEKWQPVMGSGYEKAKNKSRYYKDWRTYQMSDHLPMWVELWINHSDSYLKYLRGLKSSTAVGIADQ